MAMFCVWCASCGENFSGGLGFYETKFEYEINGDIGQYVNGDTGQYVNGDIGQYVKDDIGRPIRQWRRSPLCQWQA